MKLTTDAGKILAKHLHWSKFYLLVYGILPQIKTVRVCRLEIAQNSCAGELSFDPPLNADFGVPTPTVVRAPIRY